jgi:hypothetical protein
MNAPDGSSSASSWTSLSTRLRKLPGELARALINATAILVIVAAVLALVAMSRINNFGATLAATMTEGALSKIDLPSRDVLKNLNSLTAEIRSLRNSFQEARKGGDSILESKIARLEQAADTLSANIDRLTKARTILTDEAIGHLGRSVSDTLTKMRGCPAEAGQATPAR